MKVRTGRWAVDMGNQGGLFRGDEVGSGFEKKWKSQEEGIGWWKGPPAPYVLCLQFKRASCRKRTQVSHMAASYLASFLWISMSISPACCHAELPLLFSGSTTWVSFSFWKALWSPLLGVFASIACSARNSLCPGNSSPFLTSQLMPIPRIGSTCHASYSYFSEAQILCPTSTFFLLQVWRCACILLSQEEAHGGVKREKQ